MEIRLDADRATSWSPASSTTVPVSSPAILPRLFEAFGPTAGQLGNGLGLHVSREAARAQGGDLVLESSGRTDVSSRSPSPGTRHETCLVADDDEDIRELTSHLFGRHGWDVTTVANGEEALAALDAEPFDVAVLDQNMPPGSGLEVAAARRHAGDAIPIILWTGWGGLIDRAEAERLDVRVVNKAEVSRLATVVASRPPGTTDRRRPRKISCAAAPGGDPDDQPPCVRHRESRGGGAA